MWARNRVNRFGAVLLVVLAAGMALAAAHPLLAPHEKPGVTQRLIHHVDMAAGAICWTLLFVHLGVRRAMP